MGKSLTRSEVIEQFIKIHHINNIPKYNYDKFVYVNAHTKSIITCPIHGDFEQTPSNHLQGKGCKECVKDTNAFHKEGFKQIHLCAFTNTWAIIFNNKI